MLHIHAFHMSGLPVPILERPSSSSSGIESGNMVSLVFTLVYIARAETVVLLSCVAMCWRLSRTIYQDAGCREGGVDDGDIVDCGSMLTMCWENGVIAIM